ncbi:MAG: hypothetical protein HUJ98_08090, partial [Bacteroidaceae bacterium]|nr:hypothetical protein [Bacteroidaceae bacterium]
VSIRDYMPPYTTWMQVELEEELCGSADVQNPSGTSGEIVSHEENQTFGYTYDKPNWDGNQE